MTQHPVGEVVLRTADGEWNVPAEHENLYVRGVVDACRTGSSTRIANPLG